MSRPCAGGPPRRSEGQLARANPLAFDIGYAWYSHELALEAVRAGIVDAFQMIVCPVVVGGGKRFFPDGVRLDLALAEECRFGNGGVLQYAVRG